MNKMNRIACHIISAFELEETPKRIRRRDLEKIFWTIRRLNPHLNKKHVSRFIDSLMNDLGNDKITTVKPGQLLSYCFYQNAWEQYLSTFSDDVVRLMIDWRSRKNMWTEKTFDVVHRLHRAGYIDLYKEEPFVQLKQEIKDWQEAIRYPYESLPVRAWKRIRPKKQLKNWLKELQK